MNVDYRPFGLPRVATSRDGQRAVQLLEPWANDGYVGLLKPDGDKVIVQVRFGPDFFLRRAMLEGLALDQSIRRTQLAAGAIGEALDDPDVSLEVAPGEAIDVGDAGEAVDAWVERERSTDDEALVYIAGRLYWSWRFGSKDTVIDRLDEIRLGLSEGAIDRIAMAYDGRYWNRRDQRAWLLTFIPTGELLEQMKAGTFPGVEVSPIIQVQRHLSAPRYRAAVKAFAKAISASRPEDAVSEAVKALESMGKAVLGLKRGTLNDVKKELVKSGQLSRPLDKVFDGIWGYRSSQPGAGHGGATPPTITKEQAAFVVNTAAAGLLFLAEIDR